MRSVKIGERNVWQGKRSEVRGGEEMLFKVMVKILLMVAKGVNAEPKILEAVDIDKRRVGRCISFLLEKGFLNMVDGTYKITKTGEEFLRHRMMLEVRRVEVGALGVVDELQALDRLFEEDRIEMEEYLRKRKEIVEKLREKEKQR